mgnify:CR=1 FL=1
MGLLKSGINEVIAPTRFNAAPIGIHYREKKYRAVPPAAAAERPREEDLFAPPRVVRDDGEEDDHEHGKGAGVDGVHRGEGGDLPRREPGPGFAGSSGRRR